MAIPTATKTAVKALAYIAGTEHDNFLENVYERELESLTRGTDLFTEKETIDTVISQSVYKPLPRTDRILSVYYNKSAVRKGTGQVMDWVRTAWESESDGTPEYWWKDRIPLDENSSNAVTEESFVVVPPPDAVKTGESGLVVFKTVRPPGDDPSLACVDPYLIYKTFSAFLQEDGEERETDSGPKQQATEQVIQVFGGLAELWKEVIKVRLPS